MWLALPLNPQLTQRLTGLHHTGSNIRLGSRIAFEAGRQLTAQAKLQAERKNKQQLPRKAELLPVISPKSQRPPFRTEIEPLFYIDLIDDKPKISAYALREGELCILPSSEHWGRTPHGEPLPLSSGQVYVIGRTRRQVVVTPHPECLWGNDGLLIWTSEPAPLEIYSLSRWFHVLVRAYAPISKDHHQPTYNAAAYTRPPFPRQLAEKLQPLRERLVEILKVPDLYMRIGNFSAYVLYDNHPLFVEPNKPIIREGSILRQEEGFKIEVTDPNLLEILTYSVRCIQKKTHIRDLLMVPHEDWSWAAELLRKYDQREEALSRFQNDLDDLVGESLGLSGHTSDICQFYEYFNDQNPCHPSTLESCPVRRRGESTEDASLKLRALHRDEPPLLGAAGLRDSDLV